MESENMKHAETSNSTSETVPSAGKACYQPSSRHSPSDLSPSSIEEQQFVLRPELHQQFLCPEQKHSHQQQHHVLQQHNPLKQQQLLQAQIHQQSGQQQQQANLEHHQVGQEHHQFDQGQQNLCQRLQQLKQDQQQFRSEQHQLSPEQQQLSPEQQHLSPEQQQLSPGQNHQPHELQQEGQLNQHQYQLQQVQEQHQLSHEQQHYHRQQYQLQQIQEHQQLSQEQQQHTLEQKHQQQHDQVNKQQHHLEQVEEKQIQKVNNQQQSRHDALELFSNKLSAATDEDYLRTNIANVVITAGSTVGHHVPYYLDSSVSGATSAHHVPIYSGTTTAGSTDTHVPHYLGTSTVEFTDGHNVPLYSGTSTLGSMDGHHISHNSGTSMSCTTGGQHAPLYLDTSITASAHSTHDPLDFKSDQMTPVADAVGATQVLVAYSDVMEHNYRHIRPVDISVEQNEKITSDNLGVQNCLDHKIMQNEKVDSMNSKHLPEHQAVQIESEHSHESRRNGDNFMSVTQAGFFSSPSNSFTSSQMSITSPIITAFQSTENVTMSDKQTEVPDSNISFAKTQIEHVDKNIQALDKEKLKENTVTENVDNYVCLCTQDLLNHTRYKSKTYICGHCLKKFITICQLHQHLEKHGSGGSYHFDHISQTAYPKYDTFCSFTQTDDDLFIIRLDESVISEGTGNIGSFGCVEKATTIIHKETDELIKATVEPIHVIEQVYESPRKSRKRKQDNPKHTKPRISDLRKNDKGKKIRRKHDTKKKKNNEYYEDEKTYECQAKSDDIRLMVQGNCENNNVIQHLNKENPERSVVDFKEELTYQDNDSTGVDKPYKKRGRPRKSAGNNQKNFAKKRKIAKTVDSRLKSVLSDDIEYRNKSDEHTSLTDTDNDNGEIDAEMQTEVDDAMKNNDNQKPFSEPHTKRKKRKNATKYQVCDVCGLPVPRYNYLYHMRQHTGEKPFVCDKCGKAFAHRRFLAKHLMTHEEDKPFKCSLCSAQFCQKSEFSMHMNAHEGNRPYECRVCGIKFLSKSMLNTHQANIHMGITRFECEVCNRRFFKRSSLNVHQATHFEATMKCNFCDRMFKDRAGLKRHERIHTGEKRFRCHVCSHDFIQSTPYWVHMEKRHQMNRESVKHMLKDIRDSNKRYGIRTEINVLPTDVDHLLVSQEKTDNAMLKTKKEYSKDSPEKSVGMLKLASDSVTVSDHSLPVPDLEQQFGGEKGLIQKLYTDIKVPNIFSSNVSDLVTSSIYSQAVQSDIMSMNQIFRNIIPDTDTIHIPTTASESNTLATPETPATSTQSIDLPNSLPIPVSLGVSLSVPHQHGFIGLNPLHRALDYSSSMPHTSTYTDISSDRLNSEQQQ